MYNYVGKYYLITSRTDLDDLLILLNSTFDYNFTLQY